MKKVLLPALVALAVALASGGTVWADTVIDPLHGQCNGSGTGTCSDNGTNTPLGNSTTFGFTISPGSTSQTGDLILDILVGNNQTLPSSFTIDFSNNTLAGTATLFNSTAWTTGTLAAYLGITASPDNPIGGYLPDPGNPGATGFFVFQAVIPQQTFGQDATAAAGMFNVPTGLQIGDYIVGFCSGTSTPSACSPSGGTNNVATANSGSLVVGTPTPTPEPGSLMMLGAGLALLLGRRALMA